MDGKEREKPYIQDKKSSSLKTKDGVLLSFAVKKGERIVAAVYLVTGALSDNEPFKGYVRKLAVEFLSCIHELPTAGYIGHTNAFARCVDRARAILSALEIGRLSQFISEMNFAVLERELAQLIELFSRDQDMQGFAREVLVTEDFFSVPLPPNPRNSVAETETISVPQPREQTESYAPTMSPKTTASALEERSIGQDIKDTQYHAQRHIVPVRSSHDREKGKRRSTIIRLLQKKSDLTIKDIAQMIPGCSEKTVQRELISLIKDNIVVRKGERRWSKYSMRQTVS